MTQLSTIIPDMGKQVINVLAFLEKPIARDIFDFLITRSEFNIVGIITNESKTNWWNDNSIWVDSFQEKKYPLFPAERRLNEKEIELLSGLDYDLVLSVQYRWKIPQVLFDERQFTANIHLSPLPYYRGHHPFFHAILNNSQFFGVTLHELEEDFDTGKIIHQELFLIDENETAESLYQKCVSLGKESVLSYLDDLAKERKIVSRPQIRGGSFFSKDMLNKRALDTENVPGNKSALQRALHFPLVTNFTEKM